MRGCLSWRGRLAWERDAKLRSRGDGTRAVARPELPQDGRDVVIGRTHGDEEPLGDRPVAETRGELLEHLRPEASRDDGCGPRRTELEQPRERLAACVGVVPVLEGERGVVGAVVLHPPRRGRTPVAAHLAEVRLWEALRRDWWLAGPVTPALELEGEPWLGLRGQPDEPLDRVVEVG